MDEGRTEGVAVLRELEVELTETSSLEVKINKLCVATWEVGNGVLRSGSGDPRHRGRSVVCFRETSGRLLGEVRRTSSEPSGVDTSLGFEREGGLITRQKHQDAFCREQTLALPIAATNPPWAGPNSAAPSRIRSFFSSSAPFAPPHFRRR